jgi:DNA mismatch repair protein MutS
MAKVTPVRQQYLDIKQQHPDKLVLFRLGDFYELFDDDAEIAARELDLVLTSRNDAPMAGVPYHAVEGYVAQLIEAGYHVAVCEQVGDEPVKGLMPREVTRVITPGTVLEPEMLPEKRNNYLLAIAPEVNKGRWERLGLAYADITTGEFAAVQLEGADALALAEQEVERLAPREVILPDSAGVQTFLVKQHRTPLQDWRFELGTAKQMLLDHFGTATLDGFGLAEKPLAVQAAGAVVGYLRNTQPAALSQLVSLSTYNTEQYMVLDAATRRNLELSETIRGGSTRGSLLDVLDRTVTPMGGRLLFKWVGQPLLDVDALERRLDAVEAFFDDAQGRARMRDALKKVGDIERLVGRVVSGVAGPRDLVGLRAGFGAVPGVQTVLADVEGVTGELDPCAEVRDLIAAAITDDPPATTRHLGVIRPGYSAELDAVLESSSGAKEWVDSLEGKERERTGIKSLKVGYNKVFGYYIEVTKANAHLVPEHYIRKQTLTNSERYVVPELKEYEAVILNAEEQMLQIEQRLFEEICSEVAAYAIRMARTAAAVARLDVYANLAEVAAREDYVRPTLAASADIMEIREGRHPVVERLLPGGTRFMPNDAAFSADERILIITGPNMSGKSTYLRQVALITLLAQIGSFVPAREATIGLVDRIFTRIGAQDEIYAGQSTFMVEMVETALILSHATTKSLVVLDEVGRGTSTYDGMAIARAVIEYIHNHPRLNCRTLFATHYHELIELSEVLPRLRNYNVAAVEEGGEVVFLHRVVPGGADRSYGIHVAGLAGVPQAVIRRAAELLDGLEGRRSVWEPEDRDDGPMALFTFDEPAVVRDLREIDIDALSPLEALTKLYELQKRANDSKPAE